MNVLNVHLKTLMRLFYFALLSISSYSESRSLRKQRNLQKCSENSRIDILSGAGVKLEAYENSHVHIDKLETPFEDGHTLKFEFKTTSENATLVYAVRENDKFAMVSVGIDEGSLHFKIRCKTSYADLTIPNVRVDDGNWHQVKFRRTDRKGKLILDNEEFFEQYYVGCAGFTSLTFGSTHPDHEYSHSVQELKHKDGQFSGCIRRVHTTTGIKSSPHYNLVSECN